MSLQSKLVSVAFIGAMALTLTGCEGCSDKEFELIKMGMLSRR